MLTAKLFAGLTILLLVLAVLESRAAQPSIDVLFHATYFVIGKIHLQILLALASACFAVIYFFGSRSVTHPLNNTLGLAHFVLAMIGFMFLTVALSGLRLAASTGVASIRNLSLVMLAGVFCLLLGCATLAVNCALTGITALRSH